MDLASKHKEFKGRLGLGVAVHAESNNEDFLASRNNKHVRSAVGVVVNPDMVMVKDLVIRRDTPVGGVGIREVLEEEELLAIVKGTDHHGFVASLSVVDLVHGILTLPQLALSSPLSFASVVIGNIDGFRALSRELIAA